VVATLAAGLFIRTAAWAESSPGSAPPTISVEARKVELATMVDTIHAIGTLRANQSIIVRPEIPGVVTRIEFKDSQSVDKNDVLFRLDDSMDRAQLAQAEASLKLAERNYDRARELLSRGAGTAQARDQSQSTLDTDRAAVALARARLEKSTIRAPYAGVVGISKVDLGAYVTAGQDLVSLDDIDTVKLDFEVPERFSRFVAVKQKVQVEADAFPGRGFSGEIATIATRVDPESRSLGVRAIVPNPDRVLKPGLFARVTVQIAARPNAVTVPEEAIVPRGDRLLVYKVVDGKAVSTTVKVGLREYGRAEIVSGLNPGDMVITAGQQKVQEGSAVSVLTPESAASPAPPPRPAPAHAPSGPVPASAAETAPR
jgi:membrane fusion protein (multidrug efflux system)